MISLAPNRRWKEVRCSQAELGPLFAIPRLSSYQRQNAAVLSRVGMKQGKKSTTVYKGNPKKSYLDSPSRDSEMQMMAASSRCGG